jgi:Zn-dependent protease with chaperone function
LTEYWEHRALQKFFAAVAAPLRKGALLGAVILTLGGAGAACCAPAALSSDATHQEIKLSEKVSAEIEKRWAVIADPARQAKVEMIVNRLAPLMERNLPYDVRILDADVVNAFALAGGKVYVTRGMLDFVRTDLELAGVIAHEMVHADRKHVMIQAARNNKMTLLALAAVIASRGEGAAMMAASALQVAVMGDYSIDIECEADAHGIDALARAGYNPVGMLTLQERLKMERMKRAYVDPGIYQTHPEIDDRIEAAHAYMEDHGIPVNRKYALGNLRPSVEARSGDLVLLIDGEPAWRGRDDAPARALFSRVCSALWDVLQLETIPFDVRVGVSGQSGGDESFLIKGRSVVRRSELPEGSESLDNLREGIHRALSRARNSHPMADYYK